MPNIQLLKKRLKGVRTTQKLTKAMKTASTVKFSKLNERHQNFSDYAVWCERLFKCMDEEVLGSINLSDSKAPVAVVVIAANKGLCGNFNNDVLSFAKEKLSGFNDFLLVTVGKKATNYFESKGIAIEKSYMFEDLPFYDDSYELTQDILEWKKAGKISNVYVIYQKYINMVTQNPTMYELLVGRGDKDNTVETFIPDRATIATNNAKQIFGAVFHKLVLDSALGAQAATLMTMRSAYDTATECCTQLELEINRRRQSAVTADVIETSAERNE